LHLSREELLAIERPEADEWDAEFARACNAALPFDRCAVHVGSEGWGNDARSYGDLQVRVYDVLGSSKDLEDQILRAASSVVKPSKVQREADGAWHRILIVYRRHHFDYEATASLDFRLRHLRDRDFIFVFMYTNALENPRAIREILDSLGGSERGREPGNARGTENGKAKTKNGNGT
jgi:hypothetical protein